MTKSVNVIFDENEFEVIKEAKGSTTWHDLILFAAIAKAEGNDVVKSLDELQRKLFPDSVLMILTKEEAELIKKHRSVWGYTGP